MTPSRESVTPRWYQQVEEVDAVRGYLGCLFVLAVLSIMSGVAVSAVLAVVFMKVLAPFVLLAAVVAAGLGVLWLLEAWGRIGKGDPSGG